MFCISVPVKSSARFLAEALASLRAQDAACAVALLDASGDPAVRSLADASRLDFAWRRHGADDGQAAAIVEGWRNVPGEFLGWLNDDDMLLPGTLTAVAAIFEAEPATDIVYGHGVMLDEAGAFIGYFPSISVDPADLRTGNVICQPACFVRRAAVDRVGGLDIALHYAMDWDLWLRLYRAGARFRFVDTPLAAVRSHAAAKTRAGGRARRREVERLMAPHLTRRELRRLRLGMALSDARDNDRRLRALALRALFAIGRGGAATRTAAPILGVGRVTNRIDGRCSLVMPVRGDIGTADLYVVADRALELIAPVDGVRIRAERATGPDAFGYRLRGVPIRPGIVRCDLETAPGAWRLLRVSAESAARPVA